MTGNVSPEVFSSHLSGSVSKHYCHSPTAAVVICLFVKCSSFSLSQMSDCSVGGHRAVFCGSWIRLHDAETLGGQTGDSTRSTESGGGIAPSFLFKRLLCRHVEMTSSSFRLWKCRTCSCARFCRFLSRSSLSLALLSHAILSSSWAVSAAFFLSLLDLWLMRYDSSNRGEKMQLCGPGASFLVDVSEEECSELNIKSGLKRPDDDPFTPSVCRQVGLTIVLT